MAVDPAPTVFPATLPIELTPGDTIIEETAAWDTAHVNQGMESRVGSVLVDPRRNGKVYAVHEIRPNSTGAGAGNQWKYGIRFFSYDMITQDVGEVSYPKPIVSAAVSSDDFRAPTLATANGTTIWCLYYEGAADDDTTIDSALDLRAIRSVDGGQTWTGDTSVNALSGDDRYGGDNHKRTQVSINANGFGVVLYAVWDSVASTGEYIVQTLSGTTWGSATSILSVGSVGSQGLLVHSLAVAEDGTAMACVWNGTSGSDNQYTYVYYNGSSWATIGSSVSGGASGATRVLTHMLVNNGDQTDHIKHWISLYGVSTGSVFAELVVDSDDAVNVGVYTASNIGTVVGGVNDQDGDGLMAALDPDDTLFVVATLGSSTTSRSFYGRWDYTTSPAISDVGSNNQSDGLYWWSSVSGLDGYFEDVALGMGASAKYPQRSYNAILPAIYDTDLRLFLMSRRYDGAPTVTNYMSVFTTVAEGVAAGESTSAVVLTPGEGGYLWIQSKQDHRDSIIDSSSAIAAQDIATTAELQPIYGASRFFLNRWMKFFLRYTNWGVGDITVIWFGDNRPPRSTTVTMNPAGFPTPFGGPSQSGEFFMPPKDFQAVRTVHVRTGGARVVLRLTTTQGRTSLRGFKLRFKPTKIQVTKGILPYNRPMDTHVGSQG